MSINFNNLLGDDFDPCGGSVTDVSKPEFRGWTIEKNTKPIPDRSHDYDFWHTNYDGADGGNGLCGAAASRADAIKQIEEIESEY